MASRSWQTGGAGVASGATSLAGGMDRLATGATGLADGARLSASGNQGARERHRRGRRRHRPAHGRHADGLDAGTLVEVQAADLADDGVSLADEAEALKKRLEASASGTGTYPGETRARWATLRPIRSPWRPAAGTRSAGRKAGSPRS